MDAFVNQCEHCNEAVSETKRGRPQRFCSDRCRQAHRKIGSTAENGLRYRPGRLKPKPALEGIEDTAEFKPKNLSLKTSPLRCERVNDSTFKITNGELTKYLLRTVSGPAIAPRKRWRGSSSLDRTLGSLDVATKSVGLQPSARRRRMPSRWQRALMVITSSAAFLT